VLLLSSLTTLAGPGCIVADPPEYGEPQSTRPNVIIDATVPTTLFPIRMTRPGPGQRFNVEIQSEDAGEELVLAFFIDYGLPGGTFYQVVPVPASTNATKTALFMFEADARITDGCHMLTMLTMHEPSWDGSEREPYPSRRADVSTTHWVLHVNVTGTVPPQCPGPSESPPPSSESPSPP
jgi:hypothetical protein